MTVLLSDDFAGTGLLDGRALTSTVGTATWDEPNALEVAGGEIDADSTDDELWIGPLAAALPYPAGEAVFVIRSPDPAPASWGVYFAFSAWDGTGDRWLNAYTQINVIRSGDVYTELAYSHYDEDGNFVSQDSVIADPPEFPASFPTDTEIRIAFDGTDVKVYFDDVLAETLAMAATVESRQSLFLGFYGVRLQSFAYSADTSIPFELIGTAPALLSASAALVYHDFTANLGDTVTRYVMDLVTPSGLVRVPISSWQATLQQGRANYVQCVVPGVAPWVATIGAATEFVLTRQAVLPDGSFFEYEMARAPVGEARFDRGPTNYTCTLSGYSPGFAVDEEPSGAAARVLIKVRSISSGSGGRRVRCAIDWLLRPGQLASFEGSSFTAAYINYYVQGRDAYMDVGERV